MVCLPASTTKVNKTREDIPYTDPMRYCFTAFRALLVNEKNSGFCPEWLERSWKIYPRKLTWIPKIAIFSKRDTFSKPSFFGIYIRFQGGYTSKWPDPLHFTDRPPVVFKRKISLVQDAKQTESDQGIVQMVKTQDVTNHQKNQFPDRRFPKMVGFPNNHGFSY